MSGNAVDLNSLNLDIEAGADVEEYEKPSNTFRPPDPGTYTFLRHAESELDWQPTKNQDVYTNVRYIIQGGDANGRSVFDTLSSFVGKFRKACTIQDYLAACKFDGTPENGRRFTLRELMDAVEQTFGPFDAYIDWQAYCPDCKETVIKSSRFFPRDEEGNLIHEVECPKCDTKIVARARVKRYVVE